MPRLQYSHRWLASLSPILFGLSLTMYWVWLMQPPISAYADLGTDFIFVGTDAKNTRSVAAGDMDGDGDLDLAIGNYRDVNQVFRNEGDGNFSLAWESTDDARNSESIAWGDADGDGDLDLAVGNIGEGNSGDVNQVYRNDGNGQFSLAWESTGDEKVTVSVAWGDMDGDGDLDLAFGNDRNEANQVYGNDGNGNFSLVWESTGDTQWTRSVAWGDADGDGDLDLAVGNLGVNQLYRNDGGGHFSLAWESTGNAQNTFNLAWGDADGDGDLDLAFANYPGANQVYGNDGNGNFSLAWESTGDVKYTRSLAWGDADGDGDLDLAFGNQFEVNQVYRNEGNSNFSLAWESTGDVKETLSVTWGDFDTDGRLDLAAGNLIQANQIYLNVGIGDLSLVWQSPADIKNTSSVAWGDADGDGDLDLAIGNWAQWDDVCGCFVNGGNQIYLNNGDGNFSLTWESADRSLSTDSLAWGDMDSDGDLDLAFNAGAFTQIYRNEDGTTFTLAWQSTTIHNTKSLAWGDMDGDGDLDLVLGNAINELNELYRNDGDSNFTPVWESISSQYNNTFSVALGDMDGDGDLDLAVGNMAQPNQIYRNEGGGNLELAWESPDSKSTMSLAWGDWDGDGDLDLAVGNLNQPNQIYRNDLDGHFTLAWESTGETDFTTSVAWGDWDGDGDLDLVVGNASGLGEVNRIYRNAGGTLRPAWESTGDEQNTWSVAWGDMDGDGDLDLAAGNAGNLPEANQIFANTHGRGRGLPNNPPFVAVKHPLVATNANFYASQQMLTASTIPITYTLFDPESDTLEQIEVFYSTTGGGHWQPAVATEDSVTTNLATGPYPMATIANTHVYTWDTFASGFFGQSDNVVLRVVVHPHTQAGIPGTFLYPNNAAGPYQWPSAAATTFPFRLRGTQVRVYSETIAAGNEVAGAVVYRLPAGQSTGATPMSGRDGQPFRTDLNGYLQGHGELGLGDQLIALLPISATEKYTLYHTSAAPTAAGLDMHPVTQPGVQTLVASAANQLILFDLDVSLEWDARNDTTFLTQLEHDIQRTSQILYDLTNGQVALGRVRIYHNREAWRTASVVIQASNSQRPSAVLGGVVLTPTHDIDADGNEITNAFIPGQVRMGPTWNRFGEPSGTLGEDWPRALAHELGHYLLFMPDNYLGLSGDGLLSLVDCQGSAMTNPYSEAYSEFLPRSEWQGACLDTFAARFLDRADWETISTFYPMLDGAAANSGPANLPLVVTQVEFVEPDTPPDTLAAPIFSLVDTSGRPAPVPAGQGQAFLQQTGGNSDPTDDYLVALGAPVGDLFQARGAAPGDRICVYDTSQANLRLGCLDPVATTAGTISLHELPGWAPHITVTPVTTQSFVITVTNVAETALNVQLLPTLGAASDVLAMNPIEDGFTQTVTLTDGTVSGFVRVWVPGSQPRREMIVEFVAYRGWDAKAFAWGAKAFAWGAKAFAWGAPTMSSDGQVSLFALDNPFGDGGQVTLQALPLLPSLPAWLTPVGQAYRVTTAEPLPTSALLFRYLGRDVPAGHETRLHIYYSPDEGQTWQRLPTELDPRQNHASATVPGQGIFVLIATVEMPALQSGWNNFSYPVPTQPLPEVLASIDGHYTSVYHYDPVRESPWRLYDATVIPSFVDLVNTLAALEFGHSYWIYATDTITPYLPVGQQATFSAAEINASAVLPPATFYGWINPSGDFTPTVGMPITAEINGVICGQSTVVEHDGRLAYVIQVSADDITGQPDGCGVAGRTITFRVGDRIVGPTRQWDNSQAWFHPLSPSADTQTYHFYLPLITKPATSDR